MAEFKDRLEEARLSSFSKRRVLTGFDGIKSVKSPSALVRQ